MLLPLILLYFARYSEGARILAVAPVYSYSHHVVYRNVWNELCRRGHQLVLITPDSDPYETCKENITKITLDRYRNFSKAIDFYNLRKSHKWLELLTTAFWDLGDDVNKEVFEHPEVRNLYAPNSNETFDLVILEFLVTPGIVAFAERFNAPFIGISTLGLYNYQHYAFGSPVLTSHVSAFELQEKSRSDFSLWQRLNNFIVMWWYIHKIKNTLYPQQQEVAEFHLGRKISDINEFEKNAALIFTNQQEAISDVRPNPPNHMPIYGIEVIRKADPLPEKMKRFLDNAHEGFVYVSFGSNVQISSFPKETLNMCFQVFSQLPYKVLWKFEDSLKVNFSNIFISKWVPQPLVLAHQNIKLFVTQGGLQSTEEAIKNTVPFISMPVFCDQDYQVSKMISLNVTKRLEIVTLTKRELYDTIVETVNNHQSYKKRLIDLRNTMYDKPYNTIDNMVWWIEFVMRHKGAPHLATSIRNEPFYQRYDVDIIAFLSIVSFITILLFLYALSKFLSLILAFSTITLKRRLKKMD